jgi:cation diffusion facilitator family transporter
MKMQELDDFTHSHIFDSGNQTAERSTRWVMVITALMMVAEIWAGWWFNSMALLADGWHMSSHAVAIGLSAFAYMAARRYAGDNSFSFGTWKIEVLAGFASAMFLLGVAAAMVIGSLERLAAPQVIRFDEAIAVAVVGLVVNIVCALLLGHAHDDHGDQEGDHDEGGKHSHAHAHDDHDDDHDHHHHETHAHHHDLNLRSAYIHVIADAATSVLAILALVGGKLFSWNWLDPVMGIVGAVLVAIWAWGLTRETASVLLDRERDNPVAKAVKNLIESRPGGADMRIADLHVWRVGRQTYACILSLITDRNDIDVGTVKALLLGIPQLGHITVEINRRPSLTVHE